MKGINNMDNSMDKALADLVFTAKKFALQNAIKEIENQIQELEKEREDKDEIPF